MHQNDVQIDRRGFIAGAAAATALAAAAPPCFQGPRR